MNALLPYFICGPPVSKENMKSSSCEAIASILDSSTFGLPEVQLPMIDVRDAAHAHCLMVSDPRFAKNGRYFLSNKSMWFSEIIECLSENRKEIGGTRIKTRVLGAISMNLAALLLNQKLKDILPFIKHKIELEMDPFLLQAFTEDLIEIERSLVDMGASLV